MPNDDKQWFERDDSSSHKNAGKRNTASANGKSGGRNKGRSRNSTPDGLKDKNKTPGPVGGKKRPIDPKKARSENPTAQHARKVAQRTLDERNKISDSRNNKSVPNISKENNKKSGKAVVSSVKGKGVKKAKPKKKLKFLKFKGKAKAEEKLENKAASSATAVAVPESIPEDPYKVRRQRRAKKSGLRNGLVSIALVLMAATVLLFVIHHLYNYIAAKPELQFISEGSIEHTIGARAMIVRDEITIGSANTGDLVTLATEGSRVSVGQDIAMVVPENMQATVDNLRNTQSQISDVQQELIQNGSAEGASAIYNEINGSIEPIMDMVRSDAMNGNLSDMSSYSSSLTVLLSQRESELSELSFDDERLSELRDYAQGLENQLERNSATIEVGANPNDRPGIISFKLDGLENVLNFDMMLNSTPEEIKGYINSANGIITSDMYIDSGEDVARIASNEKQFIVTFLDGEAATPAAFEVGSRHTINVGSEGISIGKCIVERVEATKDGLFVVFSTTRYVENLLDMRTVDIEVVITETTGLRVPVGSLVNPDYDRNIATIYVNNKGFADEVTVIIADNDREFAIITPSGDSSVPNLQTVIISNPSSIKPGEKVEN